jgi:hypothetical protein
MPFSQNALRKVEYAVPLTVLVLEIISQVFELYWKLLIKYHKLDIVD